MARTLSDRLSEAALGAFVGREEELRSLTDAVQAPEPPFAVAYIHGPGGIGKSSFVQATLDALPKEYQKLRLDCREVEPTADGVLSALAALIGGESKPVDVEALSQRLGSQARRCVIVFDTYEVFGLLDTWLRQTLLPALPASVVTLIASREPPSPGWATSPGWSGMFREIQLGALGQAHSVTMLCSRGLSEEQARRINEFTRGHPLALELAAAAGRAHPDLQIEEVAIPRVVARLTEALLSGLDAHTVEALEACATVRRITEPLLAALLELPSGRHQFDALRRLSFVSALRDGLVLHDVMRDTIAYGLAQRDPGRHATYRLRAWQHLHNASLRSAKAILWQYTADLLYLVQNPIVRNAFFSPGAIDVSIEPALPADRDTIKMICDSTEPPESAAWLQRWLDRHPAAFMAARTSVERVAGFHIVFEQDRVDSTLLRSDPLTAAWCAHLDANPVMPHERVLFLRRRLARDGGDTGGPVSAALTLDIKRLYLELRPNLRRIYSTVVDLASRAPFVTPLGFVPIEEAQVTLSGVRYHTLMLDFGPTSIDGWLSRLIGVELSAKPVDQTPPALGLRTVLFTDIVGHTEMMHRLGDAKGRDVLREHERITRDTLKQHGGAEVKTMGDGFMASFSSVTSALDCAITLQRAFNIPLSMSRLPEPISIRVGLNAGEPIEEDGDLFGSTVILASRIAGLAGAGEILIPEPVRHLLSGKSFVFTDRGEHGLKGFADAVRLHEVRWRE
jgi:class 3 adenylate cyclase